MIYIDGKDVKEIKRNRNEYFKQYRQRNRDKINAYHNQYQKEHRDQINAYMRDYYKTHKEQIQRNQANYWLRKGQASEV